MCNMGRLKLQPGIKAIEEEAEEYENMVSDRDKAALGCMIKTLMVYIKVRGYCFSVNGVHNSWISCKSHKILDEWSMESFKVSFYLMSNCQLADKVVYGNEKDGLIETRKSVNEGKRHFSLSVCSGLLMKLLLVLELLNVKRSYKVLSQKGIDLASGGHDKMMYLYDLNRNFDLIASTVSFCSSVKLIGNGRKIVCSSDK